MAHGKESRIGLGVTLTIILAALGSPAMSQNPEVLYLDEVEDLDLSGNIIYAVNFGDNGTPTIGGVTFSQDEDHSSITLDILGEGPATWWGPSPGTDDAGLDQLMNGFAYRYDGTAPYQISVNVEGLGWGQSYLLQIVGYEPEDHSRSFDFIVEGETIIAEFDPYAQQDYINGQGGYLIKYQFTATDTVLNIDLLSHLNACGLCGFILTQLPSVCVDFGSGTTTRLFAGGATWQLNWGQGPWTWCDKTGVSLLDSNVSAVLDLRTMAPADTSADLVATLPIGGTLALAAHDPKNEDIIIGTMTLSGEGVNVIDLNASRVIVDEGSGMFLAPFHAPDPRLTMTVDETTGVFAYVDPIGNWEMSFAGSYAIPLIEGQELQDNIFTALGGNVPLIGGLGEFALAGLYLADESKRPQHFCEYGTGVALQFEAGGGLWDQDWSGGPWDWHQCSVTANATFLGENVSSNLETTTTGAPSIDEDMVLRFGFGGVITLIASTEDRHPGVAGQIKGDVTGTFVADANAAHATFDSDGNIVCAFGVAVNDAPDALITVTEATGTYADICQAGPWSWCVNGTMTIARLPDTPLQDNILAALQNNDLLLHAEEEFVLTGWYYRDSQPED